MTAGSSNQGAKGVFTLSLDFELIWGTADLFGPEKFRAACEIEREVVIDRLVELLVEFNISATWCVVGHLFLDRCGEKNGVRHPEIVRPSHSWLDGDWFQHDPGGTVTTSPLFLGRDLVDRVRNCSVAQEIGSHSFSHMIFGDPGCSREAAESELAESVRAAGECGIELRSFVFPRNSVGHLDLLPRHGFICYRGEEPGARSRSGLAVWKGRLDNLSRAIFAAEPPTVEARVERELVNIPASMIYFPAHGIRRLLPVPARVKRAIKGLDAASARSQIFHLWFHPTNLAYNTEAMFRGLRKIFQHADRLREAGKIEILPMAGIAARTLARQSAAVGAGSVEDAVCAG